MRVQFDPAAWSATNHYLLVFHDEVFECVAEGHAIETVTAPLRDVLVEPAERLTR